VVNFYKGEFRDSIDEFERITRQFFGGDPQAVQDNLRYLNGLFYNARPTLLNRSIWKSLQGSRSFKVKSFDNIFTNLKREGDRKNVSRIALQFIGEGRVNDFNGSVVCPIILHAPNSTGSEYQLVAGNTRLSMASALGIRPEVVILNTDW